MFPFLLFFLFLLLLSIFFYISFLISKLSNVWIFKEIYYVDVYYVRTSCNNYEIRRTLTYNLMVFPECDIITWYHHTVVSLKIFMVESACFTWTYLVNVVTPFSLLLLNILRLFSSEFTVDSVSLNTIALSMGRNDRWTIYHSKIIFIKRSSADQAGSPFLLFFTLSTYRKKVCTVVYMYIHTYISF